MKKLQRKRADAGDLVGEVGVVAALELLAVALGRDRPQQPLRVLGRQHGVAVECPHVAVVADDGRGADGHVQVGRLQFHEHAEQVLDLGAVAGLDPRRHHRLLRSGWRRWRRLDAGGAGTGALCHRGVGDVDHRGSGRAARAEGEGEGRAGGLLLGFREDLADRLDRQPPVGGACGQGLSHRLGEVRSNEFCDR